MFDTNGKISNALALTITLAGGILPAGSSTYGLAEECQRNKPLCAAIVIAQAGNYAGTFPSEMQSPQYSRVGRLAVQLIRNGSTQEVPFDWVFHTNDEFRFKIATNRDGWLYIFHRSPGGQLQLLYPQTDSKTGQPIGTSRVQKNTYYFVPAPTEGSFVFEKDTGAETFLLVIKDRPEPPALSDIMVSSGQHPSPQQNVSGGQGQSPYQVPGTAPYGQYPSQQQNVSGSQGQSPYQVPEAAPYGQYPSQQQGGAIPPSRQQLQQRALDALNYSIIPRGAQKMVALQYRGVRFKPADTGTDPGTYFAPQPDSESQDAWFVFKLNHVD